MDYSGVCYRRHVSVDSGILMHGITQELQIALLKVLFVVCEPLRALVADEAACMGA